uniref:t-SNARE coiled-coil homology domain-containing protein n=1 Tax=Araucaria cunninghamii TaxID=56994 RepID=A0A0D6R6D7_ARACU
MSAAQDPFYIVKEEIQDSVDKLQATYRRYEQLLPSSGERVHLTKELLSGCESIEWQVDELDRAIAVAAKDPVRFSIDEVELEKRKRWTGSTRTQMEALRKAVQTSMEKLPGKNHSATLIANGMRRELLRLPNDHTGAKPNHVMDPENDDFIQSESDRQVLLMKEQDQELDELSASVERLGGVGLTIHEELMGQERILNELDQDMDKTSNRLEFVQKKVALVMKKAGAKGQIMMIVFLLILFIVLVLLVFYT